MALWCSGNRPKTTITTSTILESLLLKFRETVPFMENDRILSEDFKKTVAFYKNQEWERIL